MPRRIESHLLSGPAGNLEALLEAPEEGEPRGLALICHPHPLFGGTMHNKVVYRTARALRSLGYVVLRFNFRGVGKSEGKHDGGIGEIDDARAALAWLRNRYPGLPYAAAGFSFGSQVALGVACAAGDAECAIALGYPALRASTGWTHCVVPKIFIQSTHDEHGPAAVMEAFFAQAAEPKRLIWVEAQDHFFAGGLDALEARIKRLWEPGSLHH